MSSNYKLFINYNNNEAIKYLINEFICFSFHFSIKFLYVYLFNVKVCIVITPKKNIITLNNYELVFKL